MRSGGAALAARLRLAPRRPLAAVVPPRRLRRRLAALLLISLLLACGYLFWLRDSGVVQVERVEVTGVSTADAAALRQALASAGRTMTTLHVDHDRLRRAAAGYPVVQALKVDADFPGTLRIHVVEHRPAALVVGARGRVAVAADGSVLKGLPINRRLPVVRLRGAPPSEQLRERAALKAVAVAGAAPTPLARRLVDVRVRTGKGLVARIRRGPELLFGRATRLRAKWAAAAAVLADPKAKGATYVDLRLPERPATGGVAAGPPPVEGPAQQRSPAPPETGQPAAPAAPPGPTAAPQTEVPAAPAPSPQPPARVPPASQPGAGGGAPANPQP